MSPTKRTTHGGNTVPATKSSKTPSYKNSKGTEYWFHKKGNLSYFSKDPAGAITLPDDMVAKENARTGMLMASRKK
jgi:hypothetical protein